MKKKILMFLMAVCLFVPCMILTACGQPAVVGKWEVSEVTKDMGGETTSYTKEEFLEMKEGSSSELGELNQAIVSMLESFMNQTLTIEEDESFTYSMSEMTETMSVTGTWVLEDNLLKLTALEFSETPEDLDNNVMTFKFENDSLIMSEGSVTIVFKKA